MSEINFLAKQQQIHESRAATDQKVSWWMAALIGVTALFFGSVWLGNYLIQNQIRTVQAETDMIKNQIIANENDEQSYLIFYEKLLRLRELIAKRAGGTTALKKTYTYFVSNPSSSVLTSEYDYYDRRLELTVGCNSVFCIQDVIKIIDSEDFRQDFPHPIVSDISRGSDGLYNLQLKIYLDGVIREEEE